MAPISKLALFVMLALLVKAVDADDPGACSEYRSGAKQCYTHTVTVPEENCPYTLCPRIVNQCHVDDLLAYTVAEVPCPDACCPTTATRTVRTACKTCPPTCTPMYTQTAYTYPSTCTSTTAARFTGSPADRMRHAVHGDRRDDLSYVHKYRRPQRFDGPPEWQYNMPFDKQHHGLDADADVDVDVPAAPCDDWFDDENRSLRKARALEAVSEVEGDAEDEDDADDEDSAAQQLKPFPPLRPPPPPTKPGIVVPNPVFTHPTWAPNLPTMVTVTKAPHATRGEQAEETGQAEAEAGSNIAKRDEEKDQKEAAERDFLYNSWKAERAFRERMAEIEEGFRRLHLPRRSVEVEETAEASVTETTNDDADLAPPLGTETPATHHASHPIPGEPLVPDIQY